MRKEILSLTRGINEDLFPFQLYLKAKKYGIWDPRDIDFSQDKKDWITLNEAQKDNILQRVARFISGEEAVTIDLLPMIMAVAQDGRLEEEMYLTTFLFEEAKHTEFFHLVLSEIGETNDLSYHHTDAHKKVFYELLPKTMNRLLYDQSPEALAEASTLYNMFAEGVLAETAYWGFYEGLNKKGLMPGLMEGIRLIKTDESRHISFGTYLLQRLIKEHSHLYDFIIEKMEEWTPIAEQLGLDTVNNEASDPFGVKKGDTIAFYHKQLNVRKEILKRAASGKLDEFFMEPELT